MAIHFKPSVKISKEQKKRDNAAASVAYAAGAGVQVLGKLVTNKITKNLTAPSASLGTLDKTIVSDVLDTVLQKSGLKDKGVSIVDVTDLVQVKNMPKKLLEQIPENQVALGKNAFFLPSAKEIYINRNKLPLAGFHEMGHAFNYTKSKFWKSVQYLRGPAIALAGLLAILPAVTKEIKPKNGEELSLKDKIKNKIRKFSPLIAVGTMAPVIAEEAMATIRGNNWAKEVLDSNLVKKVAKTNKWGLISYAVTAGIMGLSAFVAKKVKDNIDKKNELKKQEVADKFTDLQHEMKKQLSAHQG